MKPEERIKQFFKEAELSIQKNTDEHVFKDVLQACPEPGRGAQQKKAVTGAQGLCSYALMLLCSIWRITMKSPIVKFAVAAVFIIACLMVFLIFSKTSSVVWAIEQSIEATSQYKAILIEGFDTDQTWRKEGSLEHRPFKSWAVANEDQTMIEKYRHEVNGFPIITTNGEKTWRYDPNTNTVHIENRPYVASECWCGNKFLEQLKEFRNSGVITHWEVTYGKEPATGKKRAFLWIAWLAERYNGPRSLWIEFDMENKLPVSFKQWENSNWEGPATLVGEKITYYENLPDELFEFEIPEGATVIEH